MKSVLIACSLVFFGSNLVKGQSGYMGMKNLVDLNLQCSPISSLRTSSMPILNLALRFEHAQSDNESLVIAVGYGIARVTYAHMQNIFSNHQLMMEDELINDNRYFKPKGDLPYSVKQISVQKRWYRESRGCTAPYGFFVGLDIELAALNQRGEDMEFVEVGTRNTVIKLEPEKRQTIKVLTPTLVLGSNRVLNDRTTLGYFASVGFPVMQTANASLVAGGIMENYMDIQEHMMVLHFANSKRFQFGISLGMLLK